ncbi:MAG: hypothetical protein ACKVS8_08865 [Phycisphaerales bacterium]
MKTQKPSYTVTSGKIRLSLTQSKSSQSVMIERTHGDLETGWYPAASFLPSELPSIAEAVQLMQAHLCGSNRKEPSSGNSPPVAVNSNAASPEASAEEPPFDPDPVPCVAPNTQSTEQMPRNRAVLRRMTATAGAPKPRPKSRRSTKVRKSSKTAEHSRSR